MFSTIRTVFLALVLASATSLLLGGSAQASTGSNGNGGTATNNCININGVCVAVANGSGTVATNKCITFFGYCINFGSGTTKGSLH